MNKMFQKFQVTDYGYSEELEASEFSRYEEWINNNQHGPLSYLSDERKDLRRSLKLFWPECESYISFIFSYADIKFSLDEFYKNNTANKFKLASYTLGFEGLDYHFVLKSRLEEIGHFLKDKFNVEYKLVMDIHPVLDRDLSYRAGIGWFGKNSMLISKKYGSFTIVGSILLNKKIPLQNNSTIELDHCGQCTRCISSCPTSAINPNRTIDATKCISTFTIEEFKAETVPHENMTLESGHIFGCDICQDVCPWNNRLQRLNLIRPIEFNDKQTEILNFFKDSSEKDIEIKVSNLSNSQYKQLFFGTSFYRSGKRGLLKNLKFINR